MEKAIIRTPILGRVILIVFRTKTAIGYFRRPLTNLLKWLFKSKEITNFTYDLEVNNILYLASLVADIATVEFNKIVTYIKEIEEDNE